MSKLVVANWKSNKNLTEVKTWLDQFFTPGLSPLLESKAIELALAPPFVFIESVAYAVDNFKRVSLATQDLSPFPAGSYTGAVSAVNLSEWPVKYVIVGHLERRRYFHETENDVALKVEQALANKLTPIVCVDDEIISSQASKLDRRVWAKTIIAYEPKGAIGTGLAQDSQLVAEMVKRIRLEYADDVPVLYGGSVNELNINDYFLVSDGVLVGSISLEADRFLTLIQAVNQPPHLG